VSDAKALIKYEAYSDAPLLLYWWLRL